MRDRTSVGLTAAEMIKEAAESTVGGGNDLPLIKKMLPRKRPQLEGQVDCTISKEGPLLRAKIELMS